MSQGFYELLGVEPDATAARIRQAYQARLARLVRRLRSARQKGADVSLLEAQERSLREAREVLSDPARRRRYDAFRSVIDDGLPESAGELWEHVQTATVAPEVSLALAAVQALTDLPVGQPVPPPPQPVRVQRADAEGPSSQPIARPPLVPGAAGTAPGGPDRPTLVPATDPGIEITLSDSELAWLEQPARPAALHPAGASPNPGPGPRDLGHVSAEAPHFPPGPAPVDESYGTPATWSDEADTRSDWLDPATDAEPTVTEAHVEEDSSSIPGLGFLSRLALPKPPAWGRSASVPEAEPQLEPVYAEPEQLGPIEGARRRFGATGPFLQAVREDRGMSLDELSKATRISSRYLEAIEANAFDRLPSATFVKGYVKQVVEQLELNEPELVDEFMAAYRRQRG